MTTQAYLSGAAYELGEHAGAAADLDELLADPEAAARLLAPEAGFATYHSSEADVTELMAVAAGKTLAATRVPGTEIDAVVLATDSLPRGRAAHRDVVDLLARLSLSNAVAFTVGLMDCATAVVAVSTAASMVRDGSCRSVLVLTGDLADRATGGSRLVAGGAAVASDAAAAVLVSSAVPGRPVLASARHLSPALARPGVPPAQQLGLRVRAHRELMQRLADASPIPPTAVTAVHPSNFARNVIGLYLADVGFRPEQLRLGNVSRVAHCLGSDPIVNLADDPGGAGPAILLGSGVAHLAAVLLGEAA
ncbi:hypothetical protein AB0J80_23895 [Actinoplanes sp. NPDC049548]|uniref:hypothetical protein n=1 Tax=Actinoplanes sp. NPDC049548 TaxID=3155152 RepID=UPI003436A187